MRLSLAKSVFFSVDLIFYFTMKIDSVANFRKYQEVALQ
jgi:hypothetical protein